jgi:hypothetical protein
MGKNSKFGLVVYVIMLALIIPFFMWTDSNLDWVATYIKKEPVDIPMWISIIASIIFNAITFAFNIIVSIIRVIIG